MSWSRLDTLLWGLLIAVAAALSLQDIRSVDYWWLLRTGQLIAESGSIPRVDPYTYTALGARWIDIHWLHQLGLYGLFSLGGHSAVVLGKFALVTGCLALLAPIGRHPQRAVVSVAALALMLVVVAQRIMPRPELPTFVLLAAVLLLLDRFERTGDRTVYAIVAVQLVWVNVHGLFAVGIAVCAIHVAAEALRPLGGAPMRRDRLRRLGAVTGLAAIVSLANPNGVAALTYPFQQLDMVGSAGQRGLFGMTIGELQPTLGSSEPLALALFLLLAGLSLAAILLNWRQVSPADALLWVAFFYLAIGARRNVALFAIVVTPILVRNLNSWLDRRSVAPGADRVAAVAVALLLALLVVDIERNRFFGRIGSHRTAGFGIAEGWNPAEAAEWIARERPPAPIGHTMADGGYLIWRLWPAYKAMVDGRLEVFGRDAFAQLTFTDLASFEALDRQYHFGTVLLSHRRDNFDTLLHQLHASPGWRLTYVDDVSAAFVREPTALPRVDLDAQDLFPPFVPSRSVEADHEQLRARTRLLLAFHRYERALALWEDAIARYPDIPRSRPIRQLLRELAARSAADRETR